MIKVTIDPPKEFKPIGLVDGEDIILKCSSCLRPCCSLKKVQPNIQRADGTPLIWRARATCAYSCLKKDGTPQLSFPSEIKGTCRMAGCYKNHPSIPDEIIMTTAIIDIKQEKDSDGDITTYYTKEIK